MSFSDPIAELLTKIRNAMTAKHRYTDLPLSKMKKSILQILKDQGFIENFLIDDEKRKMRVFLKYVKGRRSVINGLKRISKPGLRKYVPSSKIPLVYGGMGIAILSTPKGVVEGRSAMKEKVGGELLCYIW